MVEQHSIRVQWTPVVKSSNGRVSIQTEQTQNFYGVMSSSINGELGKSADSFSVSLHDCADQHYQRINAGDLIKIYSSIDGGSHEVLEIDAVVRETAKTFSVKDTRLVITGLNRLELVLGLITPISGRAGQSRPPDYWIRQILREVNTQNGSARYSGDDGDGEPTASIITDTSKYIYGGIKSEWDDVGNDSISDTNLYTNNSFYTGEEIAFELIDKLSSQQYAGKRHYCFLDTNNYFRWLPFESAVIGSLSNDCVNAKIVRAKYADYNYVIIKAGKNLFDNASIIDFRYDLIQATAEGIKAKVLYLEGIRKTVATELERKLRNEKKWGEDAAPFSASYPFNLPSNWSNGGQTVETNGQLNSKFVDEVLYRAGKYAEAFLALRSQSGVKNTCEIPPTADQQNSFVLGGYYTDPYSSFISSTPALRVAKRSKTYSPASGWVTTLTMEEDVDKL